MRTTRTRDRCAAPSPPDPAGAVVARVNTVNDGGTARFAAYALALLALRQAPAPAVAAVPAASGWGLAAAGALEVVFGAEEAGVVEVGGSAVGEFGDVVDVSAADPRALHAPGLISGILL